MGVRSSVLPSGLTSDEHRPSAPRALLRIQGRRYIDRRMPDRSRRALLVLVQCGSDRAKGTWVRTVVAIDSLKSAWSRFTERDVRSRPHQDAGLVQQGRIEVPAGPQRRRGSQRERPLSLGGRLVADLG